METTHAKIEEVDDCFGARLDPETTLWRMVFREPGREPLTLEIIMEGM